MTDTEKEALTRCIDGLCAEVERLRKYTRTLAVANLDMAARLQDYIGQYDPTDAFVSEVKAENAKLRELITDVHDALCADKVGMFHKLILASMEDDMRELGIEVDDGQQRDV